MLVAQKPTLTHRRDFRLPCAHPAGAGAATNGPGTDIRLKDPACARWEKEEE